MREWTIDRHQQIDRERDEQRQTERERRARHTFVNIEIIVGVKLESK